MAKLLKGKEVAAALNEQSVRKAAALKEKGMPLCLRFCETRRGCSNWYNVILMGYGVSAFYLIDA